MEGNGGAGGGSGSAAPPWDLAMHWAPSAGSSYPQQPLALRPGGVPSSQLQLLQQQQQQELTCLKLGKRPACCWAGAALGSQVVAAQAGAGLPHHLHGNGGAAAAGCGGGASGKAAEGKRKEKQAAAAAPGAAAVPRCQVEGCHVALADAKDYHRRHKVCEAHSKAPRVVVLGAEQRFCQQCSRFHAISEFDEAKRSCRRRLAGHNERRRKSNASEAMARGAAHPHGVTAFGHGFLPPCGGLSGSSAGALSLLSSARSGATSAAPWQVTTSDISARSSAALDDLIAENRAALLAWQYFSDRSSSAPGRHFASSSSTATGCALPPADDQHAAASWRPHPHSGVGGGRHHMAPPGVWHTTLDLMQTASSAAPATSTGAPFRPVPERAGARPRGKSKDGDDASGCSLDAWAPAGGARVL